MDINISPIIDVAVNNCGKINNSDHGKTITTLIATNLLVSDDIRLIEITEKYSSSIIQLFILCCQLNKTKCLNLLLQNKTVQQYLLIKFRH